MATGIVAIAVELAGIRLGARVLTWLNLVTYAALTHAYLLRLVRYPVRTLADFVDHRRGPGYFTWVAASGVVGSQCLLVLSAPGPALTLWWVTLALWLLITYGFFAAATVAPLKPPLEQAIGGGWLLAVVATQSVALLGAQLGVAEGWGGSELAFVSLCLFLASTVVYLLIIGLIFYRFTFLPLSPAQLAPPYWINMGALAITTVAGAALLELLPGLPELEALSPFVLGLTLLFWSFGTWWIPLLLVFGVWRHLVARYPLRYAAEYWALVFPLGMYSVASHQLLPHVGVRFVGWLAVVFVWLAAGAWLVTYIAMWASGFGGRREGSVR